MGHLQRRNFLGPPEKVSAHQYIDQYILLKATLKLSVVDFGLTSGFEPWKRF